MPFQFCLPTTSSFSFSHSFKSETHPSLPLHASTHRGVLRDTLKKYKRLPPSSQAPALPSLITNVNTYLSYALAIDAGLSGASSPRGGDELSVVLTSTPVIEWRPTVSGNPVPGRESPRIKIQSLEYDLFFTLTTLGYAYTLLARASLHPLYVTSSAPLDTQQRTTAITTATKHLLEAASVHDYLARRAEALTTAPPCLDIAQSTSRAMASLAHAEATLLAVLKDDPYPAVVAQDRNDNDREWMYKAPEIPKVRVLLYARFCLAAADHAAQASSLCQAARGKGASKLNDDLLRYLEDLRKTSRAKACRFFGIDADLSGQTGNAIGWLRCGMQELGFEPRDAKKGLSFSRMKRDWSDKREDKKVERGTNWGSDAGKLEETRVIEMLEAKWTKVNDTMLTQTIPSTATLLSSLPSGRDFNTIQKFQPTKLSSESLDMMRAVPEQEDNYGGEQPSSGDDERTVSGTPVGGYPGTSDQYRNESTRSYY